MIGYTHSCCQPTSDFWTAGGPWIGAFSPRLSGKKCRRRSYSFQSTTSAPCFVPFRASCGHRHVSYDVRIFLDSLCDALLTSSTGIQHCPCSPRPKKPTGANSRTYPDTMCTSISLSGYGRPGTPICRTMSWPLGSCPS